MFDFNYRPSLNQEDGKRTDEEALSFQNVLPLIETSVFGSVRDLTELVQWEETDNEKRT